MISLIISTRNRRADVERFLAHLDGQAYRDFELVLVDQNLPPGVSELVGGRSFRLQYRATDERGASRGRNVGIQMAQGDIFAIPDDDCWYPPHLLQEVATFFERRPEVDVLSGVECDPDGNVMVPPRPPLAGWCDAQPIAMFEHRSAWVPQSSMIFFRRRVYEAIGLFPAWMGVGAGTVFGSGEETDYLLLAMRAGFKVWFEPSIRVFHPRLDTPERDAKKNYEYAIGKGALMRRHDCGLFRFTVAVCRVLLGGVLLSAMRLERQRMMMYVRRAKGLLIGYFTLPPELRLSASQRSPARLSPES